MRIYKKVLRDGEKSKSHLNELKKGGLQSFILKTSGLFLGFLLTIVITRVFGAEGFGFFSICLAVLGIISIFSLFGTNTALLRFTAENRAKREGKLIKLAYSKVLKFVLFLSLIFAVLLFLLSEQIALHIFNSVELKAWLKISALAIIPFNLIALHSDALRGLKKVKSTVFFRDVSKKLFPLVFLVVLILFLNKTTTPIISYTLGITLAMILVIFIWRKRLSRISHLGERGRSYLKGIFGVSFPMFLSGSMFLILEWTDRIILGIYESGAVVGIYSLAQQVSQLAILGLISINTISAPKIAEAYGKNSYKDLKEVVKHSSKLIFWSSVPLLIFLIIFAPYILQIFGKEFIDGRVFLIILSIGFFVNAICGSNGHLLQMTGREKIHRNIVSIAALMNLILSFILIPVFGGVGAAVSTAISMVFWNIASVTYIFKKLKINTIYIPFLTK